MEREANYGLIGGLTLVLLGAAFAFVLWLGQSQFTSDFDEYRVVFDGPVRGLNQGSEVPSGRSRQSNSIRTTRIWL